MNNSNKNHGNTSNSSKNQDDQGCAFCRRRKVGGSNGSGNRAVWQAAELAAVNQDPRCTLK